jgi:RNA polymerase sigma-70 factor (family 1)
MLTADNEEITDIRLWEMASGGDIQAFESLYKRHWSSLLDEAFRRLKVREDAEEIVQEIFIDLFTRRAEIRLNRNVAGFLYKAVQYRVYNKIRSYIVQRNYQQLAALKLDQETAGAYADAEFKELNEALHKAVSRLPDKCRQVFQLSREQGLPYKEIALRLGISTNTVERHMNKALKFLREEFATEPVAMLAISAAGVLFLK